MIDQFVAVPHDASVAEAIEIFNQHHIGGAPVATTDGRVVGMLSELALIDVVFDPAVKEAPVARYMTPQVQAVHPDDRLSRAAQLFALYSFRRLPVVEDGKLVGVISRRDLMNYALRTNELLADPLPELIPALAPIS
jgi:CBS domain-containing protein